MRFTQNYKFKDILKLTFKLLQHFSLNDNMSALLISGKQFDRELSLLIFQLFLLHLKLI
jgi:hypothetical protein